MRVAALFALLCSVCCSCVSKPLLERPREMVMDVNAPPFPIVNVIPERAPPVGLVNTDLGGARGEAKALVAQALSGARSDERRAFAIHMAEQHERLQRLKSLRASFQ